MKINREKVRVLVYTNNALIRGNIYLPPGGRLTDYVNKVSGDFIPITDAEINVYGRETIKTSLMQLNKDYIEFIVPEESIEKI